MLLLRHSSAELKTETLNKKTKNKKKGHLITLGGNVKKVIYLMSGEYFLKLK